MKTLFLTIVALFVAGSLRVAAQQSGWELVAAPVVNGKAVVATEISAPGATAVGNPARIVDAGKDESPDVKADAPARQAFTAYGVTRDLDDPLVKALHGMIDHAAETDRRLRVLVERLAKAGIPVDDAVLREDGFDPQKLGKMVD